MGTCSGAALGGDVAGSTGEELASLVEHKVQYGSGAKGLAAKNGTTVEVAQQFINNYYERYQGVAKWQAEVAAEVAESRVMTDKKGPAGYPLGMGQYESVTGRIYTFWEQESKWGNPSFKPTEMKNYPVQGLATGDMMALLRARLYRRWIRWPWRDQALPINTVHDSVVFDCANEDIAELVAIEVHEVIDELAGEMRRLWGIDVPVPIKAETEWGSTWAAMEKKDVDAIKAARAA